MAASPMILEIQTGKYKGRRVKLADSEMLVGRGENVRIRIASAEVSREHCRLVPQGGAILVQDLGSRNGTFVDGRPVNGEKILTPGGTLTVGPLTFVLLGSSEPVAPQPTRVALGGKSGANDKLSDDEIADWLSDTDIPTMTAETITDTSIIKNPQAPTANASEPVTSASMPVVPEPAQYSPTVRRKEFKTVAEEAQDIIRRHHEMVAQEEANH